MSSDTSRVIEVLISPAGDVTVQTRGFTGATCQSASRFLEQSLGETTSEQKTAEMSQQQAVPQTLPQHQR